MVLNTFVYQHHAIDRNKMPLLLNSMDRYFLYQLQIAILVVE